jgi:hypothetical protein
MRTVGYVHSVHHYYLTPLVEDVFLKPVHLANEMIQLVWCVEVLIVYMMVLVVFRNAHPVWRLIRVVFVVIQPLFVRRNSHYQSQHNGVVWVVTLWKARMDAQIYVHSSIQLT